jgi:sugar/nucleoside kinase (ribokinase family)
MRLALALGAAVIATSMVAYAADRENRFVFHRGEAVNADRNNDGWLSREEAAGEADRLFADLDRDNNGRLEDADGEALRREIEVEVERAMEGVRIEMENLDLELEGLDEEIERNLEHDLVFINDDDCETTTEERNGERTVTTICRSDDDDREARARNHAERAREHAERAHDRAERRVHVIRRNGDTMMVHPVPPIPPMPPMAHVPPVPPVPHMPAFWMGGGDNDESDLNGDGWLSREEFRAQQLRYFDARDANGDGRVRYEQPPEPPEAPEPPQPSRQR